MLEDLFVDDKSRKDHFRAEVEKLIAGDDHSGEGPSFKGIVQHIVNAHSWGGIIAQARKNHGLEEKLAAQEQELEELRKLKKEARPGRTRSKTVNFGGS
jgi:hypothetical protein